jgi:hypothetical protein
LGEEVMNRRSFFKFLPIAPIALIAEGARAVTMDEAPNDQSVTLSLHASAREDGTCMNLDKNYNTFATKVDYDRVVSMAVGEDGRLWIKSKNDEWRRVVTE